MLDTLIALRGWSFIVVVTPIVAAVIAAVHGVFELLDVKRRSPRRRNADRELGRSWPAE